MGYIAQTEEFPTDEENRLKFTVSEKDAETPVEDEDAVQPAVTV